MPSEPEASECLKDKRQRLLKGQIKLGTFNKISVELIIVLFYHFLPLSATAAQFEICTLLIVSWALRISCVAESIIPPAAAQENNFAACV